MECFVPGQVIVGPGPEWSPKAESQLREEIGPEFDIQHDISDILQVNDVRIPEEFSWKLHSFPFVARVREGAEAETAARLREIGRRDGRIKAATPDYFIRPNAAWNIDQSVVNKAIKDMGADVFSQQCGKGCTIGIIDSGVDPTYLKGAATLNYRQLIAKDPLGQGGVLGDLTGHGSVVAHIINRIAPAANLISVKAVDANGTLSDVLAGLYLAHAAGPCDIINLSLSMSCDAELCSVCNSPTTAAMTLSQVKYFFTNFMALAGKTTLIAAAGNNTMKVAMPAAIDGILAVGSYHFATGDVISNYGAVPATRFVLAPDGAKSSGEALATRPGLRKPDFLHGTSFAAAFATGVAGRGVCDLKGGPCSLRAAGGASLPPALISWMAFRASKSWPGYDPGIHGLGKLRL